MTVESCLYNHQVIGEAASALPKKLKKKIPALNGQQ
jgi:uncharacterized protein with HEPN domain